MLELIFRKCFVVDEKLIDWGNKTKMEPLFSSTIRLSLVCLSVWLVWLMIHRGQKQKKKQHTNDETSHFTQRSPSFDLLAMLCRTRFDVLDQHDMRKSNEDCFYFLTSSCTKVSRRTCVLAPQCIENMAFIRVHHVHSGIIHLRWRPMSFARLGYVATVLMPPVRFAIAMLLLR